MSRPFLFLCALSLACSTARTQAPPGILREQFEIRGLFLRVASAGDVDGDGWFDVIVNGYGKASVHSGRDGAAIWEFADFADNFVWSSAGAGDVDRDGVDDIIVGLPSPIPPSERGAAFVYSGANGKILWDLRGYAFQDGFGHAVAAAGDVNLDGFADVVVTAPYAEHGDGERGLVYVYSGKDATLLWELKGYGGRLTVAGAGDVDNDGVPDLVVGDPDRGIGLVYVYSGRTGKALWLFSESIYDDYRVGESVAAAGDLNKDGHADIIVGAPGNVHVPRHTGCFVYSGKDGTKLWHFEGGIWDEFGSSVAGLGDVDGDGWDDVAVGAPTTDLAVGSSDDVDWIVFAGSVYVYSGRDGRLLWRINGTEEYQRLGYSVSGPGDLNHDGFNDVFLFSETEEGGPRSPTRAKVFTFVPAFDWYGTGVEGTGRVVPRIGTGGEVPAIGNDGFQIRVTEGVGGSLCVIAGSLARSETSLLGGTLYGDFLTPGMFVTSFLATTGPEGFPGVGTANLPLSIPNDPDLVGLTTYWQGFVVDPGSPLQIGVSHTGGLAVTLVPDGE